MKLESNKDHSRKPEKAVENCAQRVDMGIKDKQTIVLYWMW